jgi:hypothetical protein
MLHIELPSSTDWIFSRISLFAEKDAYLFLPKKIVSFIEAIESLFVIHG